MAIKVFIQTKKFNKGGPAIFRSRLITSLNKFEDIEVTNNFEDDFDIEIAFISRVYKHDKPYILRLGNCYYFKGYKPWNNKPIKKAIPNASHVIFQSDFGKKLLYRVLRIKELELMQSPCDVIYNGVDVDYIESVQPSEEIIPGSFFSCARWDPNKRPRSMIKGFLEAQTGRHLYIAGDVGVEGSGKNLGKKFQNNKYIHFLGKKTNEETISIMKACDYQMHLSFIDVCPNVVLEGLTAGLNVLCTNLGGTPEIVGENGIILNQDKFWPYPQRYLKSRIENMDNLDKRAVSQGVIDLLKMQRSGTRRDFDVDHVAKKYANIIRNVLK